MKKVFIKKYSFACMYAIFLIAFSVFVIYDALKIPKDVIQVNKNEYDKNQYESIEKIIEHDRYQDENIIINISYDRAYDSQVYIAEIELSDSKFLKTAFAKEQFGRNVVDITSRMANKNHAIFAINGDYYGFRNEGFVIRNGIKYRDSARKSGKDSCLFILRDGNFKIVNERECVLDEEIVNAQNNNNDIIHAFTFGPALIIDNEIVSANEEEDVVVHPRMGIGMIEPLHYIIVAVDGRTEESKGITIKQLAEYLLEKGCNIAYNLDGGSSASMYFNGRVVNKPSNGLEREVSDIVYIGY